MTWPKRTMATGLAVLGILALVASPAQAQAIFHGAGYKLTDSAHDLRYASTSFRVPTVDCTATPDETELSFGLFSRGVRWAAGVLVVCEGGAAKYALFAEDNWRSAAVVQPGDQVQVTMDSTAFGGATTDVRVADTRAGLSFTPIRFNGELRVVSVGAYAAGEVPGFSTLTMSAVLADGAPFTSVDHVRHTAYRDGTKVIGTGFPWADGEHFHLYFKHH